jgi:DNA adenine methylase
VEPYARGAAIAWELLITGVVRRVSINDISRPVYAFWNSVLNKTDELCTLIEERPLTVKEWDNYKGVFRRKDSADELELGFLSFT